MNMRRKRITISVPEDQAVIGQWLTLQSFVADIISRQRKATSISHFERERLSTKERKLLFKFIELLSAEIAREAVEPSQTKINESIDVVPQFLHLFHEINKNIK